jgi:ATP-dependent helicase HrpB
LVLDDRLLPAEPEAVAETLAGVFADKLDALPWTEAARQLQARAALLRRLEPSFPDISDAALAASTRVWLAPHLQGISRLSDAARLDLLAILRGHLGWEGCARLDRDLPMQIELPGGGARVDYSGEVPAISARAQAFYGLTHTPMLAGGRINPQLCLLSPAGRPIAITGDITGFWRGGWADARRDMRGRYPKHDWPMDPSAPRD